VTGTDTGVGKTLIAAALIHKLAQQGKKVVGMKPVASGGRDDALALMAEVNVEAPYELVNPYCFEPAIAPHIAAAQAGVRIEMQVLQQAHAQLNAAADIVVAEGAGGWLTPLNERETLADFARLIAAEVVLVVGLRLGCINHALLTARAIGAAGLKLSGWVANTLEADMPRALDNIQSIEARLPAPLLCIVPYNPGLSPPLVARQLVLPRSIP
jgi:dethiobiotin synthetase